MRVSRRPGWLAIVGLLIGTVASAKLPFFPLDYYIRRSDQIVLGRVSKTARSAVEVSVTRVLLGKSTPAVSLPSHNLHGWEEDEPTYQVGEEALFFLERSDNRYGLECVQGMAGKVDVDTGRIRSYFFPAYERDRFVQLVSAFVDVRHELAPHERLRRLIQLLASDDPFVITAASSYLNFLVRDQEHEDWLVKPRESERWSYDKYYRTNALAHKRAWLKWWEGQR